MRISAAQNYEPRKLRTEPVSADFDTVSPGVKLSKIILLTNEDISPSSLVVIEKPSQEIVATEIEKMILKNGEATQIKFTLSNSIGAGLNNASLTLEAANKPDSRISIPVRVVVKDKGLNESKPGK